MHKIYHEINSDKYIELKMVQITKEMIEVIENITNEIWESGSKVMANECQIMANAEFIMIQHHDDEIKLGEWGNIAVYSRSKAHQLIRTWYNKTYSKIDIRDQVTHFVRYCAEQKLPIK